MGISILELILRMVCLAGYLQSLMKLWTKVVSISFVSYAIY